MIRPLADAGDTGALIQSDLDFLESQPASTAALHVAHTLRRAGGAAAPDGATALARWIRRHLEAGTVTIEHGAVSWRHVYRALGPGGALPRRRHHGRGLSPTLSPVTGRVRVAPRSGPPALRRRLSVPKRAQVLVSHDEYTITAADNSSWAHLTLSRNPDPAARCYDWALTGTAAGPFDYKGRTVGSPAAALEDIRAAASTTLTQSAAARLALEHCAKLLTSAARTP
jgi:hypothetical protein